MHKFGGGFPRNSKLAGLKKVTPITGGPESLLQQPNDRKRNGGDVPQLAFLLSSLPTSCHFSMAVVI
jgi:hypothetical protein